MMDFNSYPILSIYYLLSIILMLLITKIYKTFGSIVGKVMILFYIISSLSFVGFYLKYNENYFKLFNLKKNFNEKDLKMSYKNLSKIHHPDINDSDENYFLFLTNLKEVFENMLKNESLKKIYDYFGDKEDIIDWYYEKRSNKNFKYYFNFYSEKYYMEYIIILFLSFLVLKELELKTKKAKLILGLSAIFLLFETFLYDYYNYPHYSIYLKNLINNCTLFEQNTYFEISFILKFLTITYVSIFLIYQNIFYISDLQKIDIILNGINKNNEKESLIKLKENLTNNKKIVNDKRKEFRMIIVLIVIMLIMMNYNGNGNNNSE